MNWNDEITELPTEFLAGVLRRLNKFNIINSLMLQMVNRLWMKRMIKRTCRLGTEPADRVCSVFVDERLVLSELSTLSADKQLINCWVGLVSISDNDCVEYFTFNLD